MPAEFKDYYEILGVPRDASNEEIKKAFRRVSVRIKPGTKNGQQLRLRGHGLPTSQAGQDGDLYVIINVQLPEHITAKERDLWKELSRVSQFNPRTY